MSSRYRKNAGAVFSLKYHIVFCPKYRRSVLNDIIAKRFKDLLEEVCKEHQIQTHATEVMPDHVHLFIEADPTLCVAEIVNRIKGKTSRVLRKEFPELKSKLPCLWSRSYYCGTVGHVSSVTVQKYIENQKGK